MLLPTTATCHATASSLSRRLCPALGAYMALATMLPRFSLHTLSQLMATSPRANGLSVDRFLATPSAAPWGLAMDKGSPTRTTSTREMLRLDAMMLMSTTAMPTLSTSPSLQMCMHLAALRTDTHSTSSELVSNLYRRTVLPTIHTTSRLVSVLLLLFLPRTILSS